jgi:hypothetical protein
VFICVRFPARSIKNKAVNLIETPGIVKVKEFFWTSLEEIEKMRKITTWLGIALIAVSALLATACPQRETISNITNNPAKYVNKEVVIAGTVQKGFGISIPGVVMSGGSLRGGVYKIDDGTGSIWVMTDHSVPSEGSHVGIRGRVQDGVNWNGKNYGLGVYEKERKIK